MNTSAGLKQVCVLAPPVFNVCLDVVIHQLLPDLRRLGVTICYEKNGQLELQKSQEELTWILLYADFLGCDTAEKLREAVTIMDATFALRSHNEHTEDQNAVDWQGCWCSKLHSHSLCCVGDSWR